MSDYLKMMESQVKQWALEVFQQQFAALDMRQMVQQAGMKTD